MICELKDIMLLHRLNTQLYIKFSLQYMRTFNIYWFNGVLYSEYYTFLNSWLLEESRQLSKS